MLKQSLQRVTTAVLALFMTASSGFSYAVPVYAQEVTTATARRKKEEEFSSTESSTLTLKENDQSNTTSSSSGDVTVTANDDSKEQPEVTVKDADTKEPGRKLSSEKAQDDLKKIIQSKKYSYEDILQRIFEIDDFDFYSTLTLDDIKFLMSGKTEEKYEIAELLMYKSVYLYADYNITSEDFYSELSQYFQFLDECNVDLKDEEIEKIEKQLLLDINIYYVGDENLYQKDLDEYLTHIIETTSKGKQDICKKYIEEMHKYIFSNKNDRNRNNIRTVFGLKEETKSKKETASEAIKKKAEDFSITEGSPLKKYSDQEYSSNTAFRDGCVFVYIKDSDTGLTTTGKLTVSRNNDVSWNYMQANTTWWNCKLDIIGENYHNLSLRSPTVSTDLDAGSKDANGAYSKFIINIYLQYTQHAHHKISNISYDAADAGRLNFNKYSQFDNAGGSIPWSLEHADTDQKDVNLQINTAQLGLRTISQHRYCGTSATITYSRPDYTVRYYDKINPEPIDTKTVSDGNTANTGGIPSNPSRDGYRFTEWKNYEGQSPWDKTICGADENFYAQWVKQYRLDVNAHLEGESDNRSNTEGLGTFDVYVNGTRVDQNVTDAWKMIDEGATVEIKNVQSVRGMHYTGNATVSRTMNGDQSIVLEFSSGSTISIDPNGGTYNGSTGVSKIKNAAVDSWWAIDAPTRQGYKFAGYRTDDITSWFGSSNGVTNNAYASSGTWSQSYVDSEDRNTDSNYYAIEKWSGINVASDTSAWNYLSYPQYTAQAGHNYKITGKIKIIKKPSGGDSWLNLYHGAKNNDWENCKGSVQTLGKWTDFSIERTFDTTTSDARFEIYTSDLKGLSGDFEFYVQGLKITDTTTGNDVPMTKIQMADNDVILTARWVPLHHTLSYDAQGGSLASVKSSDNPNEYKIIDNGEYFIQSGLNSARYLHDYNCSTDDGAKVCTYQGYSKYSKQTIWTFERYKNTPYYYIINKYNGKALNLSGDGPSDLSNSSVEMWTQITADNENQSDFLWYLKETSDGYVNIYNKMTNKVLDITNAEDNDNVIVGQYTPNGTNAQKFKLISQIGNYEAIFKTSEDISYLKNEKAGVKTDIITISVDNGYMTERSNGEITTTPNVSDPNIKWYIKKVHNETFNYDEYHIINANTGHALINSLGKTCSVIASSNDTSGWEFYFDSGNKLTIEDIDSEQMINYDGSGFNCQEHRMTDEDVKLETKDFPTRQKYTDSAVYINSAIPTKKNYRFVGWNTQSNGKGTMYQPGDLYDKDQDGGTVTLYAMWEEIKYDVNIDPNGGIYDGKDTTSVISKFAGEAFSVGLPTRDKYNFIGWIPNTLDGDAPTDFAANKNGAMITTKHKEEIGSYKNPSASSSQALYSGDGAIWTNIDNTDSTSKYNTIQSGKMHLKAGHTYKVQGIFKARGLKNSETDEAIAANVNLRLRSSADHKVGETDCKKVSSNNETKTVSFEFTPQSDIDDATFELSVEIPSGTKSDELLIAHEFGVIDTTTGAEGVGTEAEGIMGSGDFTLTAQWRLWKHQVVYNANANNDSSVKYIPEAQTKTANVDLKLSDSVPTRTGYTFLGWSTTAEGENGTSYAPGATYTQDQNGGTVTLYARWTPWKHVIHYDKNVPSSSTSQTVTNMPVDQTKTFGKIETISIMHPVRKGYTFEGWALSAKGDVVYKPNDTYATDQNGGTVTLYAQWTAWKHTVHYDSNIGNSKKTNVTNMPADQTKTFEKDMTLSSDIPTRTGYTFDHWSTTPDGKEGTSYKAGSGYTYDMDSDGGKVTLYAIWTPWKYTVKYDKNVSETSSSQTVANMPSDQTKTEEVALTLSSNKPTRNGYTFGGWQVDGTGTIYQPGSTFSYDPDEKGAVITLKAKWTAWTHTVTFNENVSTDSSSKKVTDMPSDQTKTFDKKMIISATKPVRYGYIFDGWSTSKDGTSGDTYLAGDEYKHDQNGGTVTLYAQWTPWKHTIRFDVNGGNENDSLAGAELTKEFDKKTRIPMSGPERKGYNFDHWSTSKDGTSGDSYYPGDEYKHDQNGGTVILYAQWVPWTHTVKYDSNIPSNSSKKDVANMPKEQTKTYGTTLKLRDNIPTRTGYTFDHWSTTPDGKDGTSYKAGSGYIYDRDSDGGTVTLYAIWTPWKYTVTYNEGEISKDSDSQNVTNMPTSQVKTEEIDLTLSNTKPTRYGYIFGGWQIDGKGTVYQPGSKLSYDPDVEGAVITLKAKWTPWQFTIHYDKNVPASSSSQTVTNMPGDDTKTYDEDYFLSTKVPVRKGYNFEGWVVSSGTAIAVYKPGSKYNGTEQNGGTVTVYAQWTPWEHTVHYDANGGDQSSVPADQTKTFDQNMNVASKIPTRSEYKFLGWTTKADGTGTSYQPGDAYNHDQNGGTATLYAKWVQLYTVKYDGNASTIKGSTVTGSVASQTQGQDESVNLQNNNFKNNSGIYKGWSVGQKAYLYSKRRNEFTKFIHEEGHKTDHETMRTEKDEYDMIEDSLTQN